MDYYVELRTTRLVREKYKLSVLTVPSPFTDRKSKWWWWVVRHKNGQIILTSEMYTRKASRTRVANRFAKLCGLEIKK